MFLNYYRIVIRHTNSLAKIYYYIKLNFDTNIKWTKLNSIQCLRQKKCFPILPLLFFDTMSKLPKIVRYNHNFFRFVSKKCFRLKKIRYSDTSLLGEKKLSEANRFSMICNIGNILLKNIFTILQISSLQTNTQTRFAAKRIFHIDVQI